MVVFEARPPPRWIQTPIVGHGGPLGLLGLAGWLLWVVWLVGYGIALLRAHPASARV